MSQWEARYRINSCFYFNEELNLNGIRFFSEKEESNNFKSNFAELKVLADSYDKAEKAANKKIEEAIKSMIFSIDQKIEYDLKDIQEINSNTSMRGSSSIGLEMTISNAFPANKENSVREIMKLSRSMDEKAESAYESYIKGINVYDWENEAFLNFFKSIESISHQYRDTAEDKKLKENQEHLAKQINKLEQIIRKKQVLESKYKDEIRKICNEISNIYYIGSKIKMKIMLIELELEEYVDDINELYKLRSKVVAHGGSNRVVRDNELIKCKEIAKDVIMQYISINPKN